MHVLLLSRKSTAPLMSRNSSCSHHQVVGSPPVHLGVDVTCCTTVTRVLAKACTAAYLVSIQYSRRNTPRAISLIHASQQPLPVQLLHCLEHCLVGSWSFLVTSIVHLNHEGCKDSVVLWHTNALPSRPAADVGRELKGGNNRLETIETTKTW